MGSASSIKPMWKMVTSVREDDVKECHNSHHSYACHNIHNCKENGPRFSFPSLGSDIFSRFCMDAF